MNTTKKNNFLKNLLLFLTAILMVCCSELDIKDEALIIAKDNHITQDEFFNLQKKVVKEAKYANYKNSSALYNYLLKFFEAKKMAVNIYNPEVKKQEPFNVNVFFENSYSMDGYIKSTELKSSLYDILVNTKKITNDINLNYINDKIINLSGQTIQDFSIGLTPNAFKKLGGNIGDSDIAEIIKKVLSKTDAKNMSVLVSDFVFSPPIGTHAQGYLNIQQTSIKDAILDKLKELNLAIAIFQMNASFNGLYYSYKFPKGKQLATKRPYYIWVIGSDEQIKQALDNKIVDETNNDLLNFVAFSSMKNIQVPDYKVTTKVKGDFKPKDKHHIYDTKASQQEFSFNVAVNFSNSIKGLKYFNNNTIYSSNNYKISVRDLNQKEKDQANLSSYTHILTLTTNRLQTEKLVIKILNEIPQWVMSSSSPDDQNIITDKIEQTKTFGLNNLIIGVSQGFSLSPNQNTLTELTINIEK